MQLELPDGPADASYLEGIPNVEAALPALITGDGDIVAFVVIEETEGELFAYTPYDGWESVDRVDAGQYQEIQELWELLLRDTFSEPIPDGMRAITDLAEAREHSAARVEG